MGIRKDGWVDRYMDGDAKGTMGDDRTRTMILCTYLTYLTYGPNLFFFSFSLTDSLV